MPFAEVRAITMKSGRADKTSIRTSYLVSGLAVAAAGLWPFLFFESQLVCRVLAVAGVCLTLWLFELVPAFVPTLLLWVLIPLTLSPIDSKFSLANTLRSAADPVLGLFFGGFALGVAAERHGISHTLADWAIRRSGRNFARMLVSTMVLTAFASMWISNIAAAALMFGAVRPIIRDMEPTDPLRRTLLVAIAFSANLGGIATPVGTGPNAIAIAHVSNWLPIGFLDWMFFGLPLAAGLILLAFWLLWWKARDSSKTWNGTRHASQAAESTENGGRIVFLSVMAACVLLWITEPLHRIPAAVVALAAAASLFVLKNLTKSDLAKIDWSTLLLIAGGITLGRLLETSGLIASASTELSLGSLNPSLLIFVLCIVSATLAALMSNTASVAMLIPLAAAFMPQPSTSILIAISASFGMTFVISTPQNAMAHGEGGVRSSDLFYPGIVIMLVGCALVALTGRTVLNLAGIP